MTTVEEDNVAEIVAAWTGIPVSKVSKVKQKNYLRWKNYYTNG